MSRTNHHRNQKNQHLGHDYGSRYKCNRKYSQSYGKHGRDLADSERRNEDKLIVRGELDELADNSTEDIDTVAQDYLDECKSLGCEPNRSTLYSLLEEKGLGHWPDEVDTIHLKVSLAMNDKEVLDFNKYLESQRIDKKMITFEKIEDMPHCGTMVKRGDEIVGWVLKTQNGCFKLKLRDVEYKLPSFLKACEKALELFEEES